MVRFKYSKSSIQSNYLNFSDVSVFEKIKTEFWKGCLDCSTSLVTRLHQPPQQRMCGWGGGVHLCWKNQFKFHLPSDVWMIETDSFLPPSLMIFTWDEGSNFCGNKTLQIYHVNHFRHILFLFVLYKVLFLFSFMYSLTGFDSFSFSKSNFLCDPLRLTNCRW